MNQNGAEPQLLNSFLNGLRKGNQCGLAGVDVENFKILEEAERERWVNEVVDNEALSRGRNGEGRDWGLVSIDWQESSLLRRAKGDTAGLNGAEVRERTDERPEIVGRSKEGAREIEGGYLAGDGG